MGLGRAGAGDDEVHAFEVLGLMLAAEDRYSGGFEPGGEVFGHGFGGLFQQAHVGPEGVQETESGAAAAAGTDDGYAAISEFEGHGVCLSAV
jgi:hypothetical protein